MFLLPQEIEVWYIIPALRSEIAKRLVKEYKFTYDKTGDTLGISKAAVSQYLKNKRANKIKFSSEIKKEIEKTSKIIAENPNKFVMELQRLLKEMKEQKCSCELCKKFNKDVIKYCNCQPKW